MKDRMTETERERERGRERERERERESWLVFLLSSTFYFFRCHASSRCIVICSDAVFLCVFLLLLFFNLTHPYNLLYSFVFDILYTFRY